MLAKPVIQSLIHGGEQVSAGFLQIWVCAKDLSLLSRRALPLWVSKNISEESLLASLGSNKVETSGFMPADRGWAFGVAGAGLVGKFWNILCCSNWAFCKVSSSNSYSSSKCSVCCRISWGVKFTLKWQNYSFNESPQGPEINWNIFSSSGGSFNILFYPVPNF